MEHKRFFICLVLYTMWTACLASSQATSNVTTTDHFIKRACYDEIGQNGCGIPLMYTYERSKISCAWRCNRNETCSGFVYYTNTLCVQLQGNCFQEDCPANISNPYLVYEKDTGEADEPWCLHNGVWNAGEMFCACTGGWVGDRCERLAYDCPDLVQSPNGYSTYTDHFVLMDLYHNMSRIANITCFCFSTSCRAYIFHNLGRSSHNRTWDEYVNGYNDTQGSKWMGLENVLAFNRMGYDVVEAGGTFFTETVDYQFGCTLLNFTITDSSSGYSYNGVDDGCWGTNIFWNQTVAGSVTNVLTASLNVPFSTYDRDQDLDDINCALANGAGWWFKTCPNELAPVNPLGANPDRTETPEKEKMRYLDFDFTSPELNNYVYVLIMQFLQEFR